ncbi:MAG: RNA polymerase factor sigma-54 [Rhabdochlamydiaceae bacterium]|nr:RNA polymerase factor sigma-54 [Rhabdochlamydiaceae bacterium]
MDTLSIKQNANISTKQSQHLLLSLAMQQAFHVLQMPVLELAEWLRLEIEQNPLLEIDHSQDKNREPLDELCQDTADYSQYLDRATEEFEKKRKAYQESLLTYPISLYEHLMVQARFTFETQEELNIAELLIGHLDKQGFLSTPLNEIAPDIDPKRVARILGVLQTFDPPGIAALDLRSSLLQQLRLKDKENTLGYTIVEKHFENLIHNRLPLIAKQLKLSIAQVQQIVSSEISPLDIHPGYPFHEEYACPLIADVHLDAREGEWFITVNHGPLPHFKVSSSYTKGLEQQEKVFVRRHLANGKWLKKIVHRRQDTLRCIATYLIKKQEPFLSGEQKTLHPMTIQEMADALQMHESTIARAISNKHISCPQGMFSLRSFFTHGITCQNGQKVSNHTLRQLLAQIVEKEDKIRPLSDDAIAHQFKKMGIPCARRTVAKYRQHMRIAPAARRRKWSTP